ncbi:MAG TPA: NAD(P)H-dependent oxidoreductase subunit E [Kiritimatiellia bacterium]|nr:NAD(P)H-dependent oxidoreductase subunit E [Kiritimatiellia bacterium]HNS80955.1 NAD(P)H-dependent oxidoreductase subunit E [Kiritimatiellia bacterium]HPA78368.1 NAD(P)H-dependent oxidoreductase subunit E [Kiritimatiellia bacterium]HQQ03963.1 NAD(P)H-dependent oxidoreductase subunit E [Kiritimatiellia bacterium]
MLTPERDQLAENITKWIDQYGGNRSALLPTLQEIQKRHGRVTEYAMQVVADKLSIHPVEVYGVITFYAFLDTKYKGRFIIRLCRTISCDMAGKSRVARQLENDLGIKFGESTADGRFTLEWANCLGLCDHGPALLVNSQVFTHVTPEKVHDIIESCRKAFGAHTLQKEEVHIA